MALRTSSRKRTLPARYRDSDSDSEPEGMTVDGVSLPSTSSSSVDLVLVDIMIV